MAEYKNTLTLQTESGQSVSIDLRNALILTAAPTTSTAARAGMQAYVVSGGKITAEYVCTAVSGSTYTWVKREISGGGGGVFTAVYGETAYSDIRAAYDSGMVVMVKKGNLLFVLSAVMTSRMYFINKNSTVFMRVSVGSDETWSELAYEEENATNKVTEITEESTDTQYPSAKAVYDYAVPKYFGEDRAGAQLVVGEDGFVKSEFQTADVTETSDLVVINPAAGTDITVVSQIMQPEWAYGKRLVLRHLNSPNVINIAEILRKKYGGNTWTTDGLTCTINDNDTLTIKGTATADDGYANPVNVKDDDIGYLLFPAGTYTIPKDGYAVDFNVTPYNPDGWVNLQARRGTFTTDVPFFVSAIGMAYKSGEAVDETIPLAMVMGSTFPSSGWKYNGDEYKVTFTDKVQAGSFDWHTGELRDVDGVIVQTVTPIPALKAKEGKNYIFTGAGTSEITYVTEGSNSGVVTGGNTFDPEAWGLPVLYLAGNTTTMDKDNAVEMEYSYGDKSGICEVKWQGSSSLAYVKKNYTVKFDNAFEAQEGWGEQRKYCLKANFIDHSHARNLCNAKLWGQIVKSRDTVPSVFANLPNAGAVDGFPILLVLNNKFHGLYTWNIPKDGWMMGMGSGSNEAIICADNWVDATGFKGTALVDGSDFELEYVSNEDNTGWVATSLNQLINACIASDGTDLDSTIATYLDWDSAIDYYIFTVLVEGADMTQKNYLLVTFDGTKWYFSAYDMDSTHGLRWDGGLFLPADNQPTFVSYANIHRVMELIKTYKKDALKERYNELRGGVLSESNLATVFNNFVGLIPAPVYIEEENVWTGIPNTSANNVSQIRDYYRMRVGYADKWIENL